MAEIPPVKADHNLMRQVVLNLLSNAVKFTGKNAVTRILVGYYQKDEQHVIFVKDNGVGFDMNYASKLFGVFQRLHSDHDFEGLGVGLSLVKRIITRHNGKIWAESEVDKGATFFFSIPLEKTKSKDGEIKNDE
jgi:light-regulated signal transduction histidine kinase (bacteriophytochrome)